MTTPTEVTVREFTDARDVFPTALPGDADATKQAMTLLAALIGSKQGRKFIVSWKGPPVPSGVAILGSVIEILNMRQGHVRTEDAVTGRSIVVGNFQKVFEFAGPSADEHMIAVRITKKLRDSG